MLAKNVTMWIEVAFKYTIEINKKYNLYIVFIFVMEYVENKSAINFSLLLNIEKILKWKYLKKIFSNAQIVWMLYKTTEVLFPLHFLW